MKFYIIIMAFIVLFQIHRNKKNFATLLLRVNNLIKNKKTIRIFKLVFKNCGTFFLWIPFWVFMQIGLYQTVSFLSQNFSLGNRNIYPFLPATICYIFQPWILMCVISQFKRKLEKKKNIFITGIIQGLIYFMPQYIISIKKKIFPPLDIYTQIYFVLDKDKNNNQEKKARILKDRMTLYAADDILAALAVLIFLFHYPLGPIISWLWYSSEPQMVIARCLLILILTFFYSIEIFGFLYTCYLYLWNTKWEETYEDVLSEGKVAPNIETVEFPEL